MATGTRAREADLDNILAAARRRPSEGARRGHSPLYEWMWSRAEQLAPELDPPRTPNWTAMAEEFQRAEVMDGQGRAPTAETVRKTWWKVRKDRLRQASGGTVLQVPAARRGVTPPPPSPETRAAVVAQEAGEDEETPRRFTFAKPRT